VVVPVGDGQNKGRGLGVNLSGEDEWMNAVQAIDLNYFQEEIVIGIFGHGCLFPHGCR
jgi:hypothetical protein